MKTTVKIALLGVTATAIALGAAAPTIAKGKHGMMFERLDTNADGFIDQAEITAARDTRFATVDTNNDGALDADELAAHHETKAKERAAKRHAKMMERLDANKDGKIQKDEMGGDRMAKMMDRLDADGDGRISKDEAKKMRGKRKKPSE